MFGRCSDGESGTTLSGICFHLSGDDSFSVKRIKHIVVRISAPSRMSPSKSGRVRRWELSDLMARENQLFSSYLRESSSLHEAIVRFTAVWVL
jgi:hypothetical protein